MSILTIHVGERKGEGERERRKVRERKRQD